MNGNAVRDGLDRLGLPWRMSKAELKARAGISHWPLAYDPVVFVEPATPLPGLLAPLSFRDTGQSPDMPPANLHGYFWVRDDPAANLAAARAAFEPFLGTPRDGRGLASNIEAWEWVDRPAQVRLTAWPAKLNRDFGSNSVHDAEPRTRAACSISIGSGYRLPCSETELRWLAEMDVVGTVRRPFKVWSRRPPPPPGFWARLFGVAPQRPPEVDTPQSLIERMNWGDFRDHLLEYRREPPANVAEFYGKVGVSPGGEALIVCTEELLFVPRAEIDAIEIVTITPGRSYPSGGKEVSALCRPPYAPDGQERLSLQLARNDIGDAIATSLGAPVQHSEVWGD